jgi:hypothetical protein
MTEEEARELMEEERALMEEGKRMEIDYLAVSEDARTTQQERAVGKQSTRPVIEHLPLEGNGHMYTPQELTMTPTHKAQAEKIPTFKGISQTELGELVDEVNLSQVSENLDDVLNESDLRDFQASKYGMLDSRILEPTQGKSEIDALKDVVAEKKNKKSAVSKFIKREPMSEVEVGDVPSGMPPN